MKALIFKNKVVDVQQVAFPVHESMTWVDCPDEVKNGWDFDGNGFSAPVERELTYAEKRSREYPLIVDQLDAIMKWIASETTLPLTPELKLIAAECMNVKAKYPKPRGTL